MGTEYLRKAVQAPGVMLRLALKRGPQARWQDEPVSLVADLSGPPEVVLRALGGMMKAMTGSRVLLRTQRRRVLLPCLAPGLLAPPAPPEPVSEASLAWPNWLRPGPVLPVSFRLPAHLRSMWVAGQIDHRQAVLLAVQERVSEGEPPLVAMPPEAPQQPGQRACHRRAVPARRSTSRKAT